MPAPAHRPCLCCRLPKLVTFHSLGHKAWRVAVWGRGWTMASYPQLSRARCPFGSVSARGPKGAPAVRPAPSEDPGPLWVWEWGRRSQATSGVEPGRRWGGGLAASRNPRKGGLPCKAVSSRSCPSASGDLTQKTDHQLVHPGPGSAGSPAAALLPGFPGASCGRSDHFPEAHPSPACSSGLGPPGVGIIPLQRPLGGCAVLGTPHRPPHSQAQ